MKKLKCIIPALCATVLVGCVKKEETQVDTTPIVKLEKVSYFPVDQTYEYTGTIEAFNSNNIGPSMPLRIGEIQVEVGDFVKAGQPVVLMDKAQYIQQKAQRDNLQATYDRLKNLYETGGISKQDLDQAETALIVSKTAVQNLEENSTLRSPISGIVTARNYDRGDMSSALPILVIQQISPVKVVINVSEELFPKLKKGMDVALNLDIYPGETFPGKIHLIHPTVDARMHTFAVE
ncbi:MAG: efflux RND transporter periplasmic adaptor subunit, partial [Bacteroidales bacterium]|nr:efflux RND transporter periplasmic adaptor subunit [Bacteroidales bacterium]